MILELLRTLPVQLETSGEGTSACDLLQSVWGIGEVTLSCVPTQGGQQTQVSDHHVGALRRLRQEQPRY